MPTSIAFYRDALGFEIVESDAVGEATDDCDWAWLRLGGANLMLNTAYEKPYRPEQSDPSRVKAHADTGLYFECPDVDGVFKHLQAQGIDVLPPQVATYGMQQLYVSDPDGYHLCFQWPAADR